MNTIKNWIRLLPSIFLSVSVVAVLADDAKDADQAHNPPALSLMQADEDAAATDTPQDSFDEVLEELENVEASASGEYDEDEDDEFVPTQEVSSDQSLKFPVDI